MDAAVVHLPVPPRLSPQAADDKSVVPTQRAPMNYLPSFIEAQPSREWSPELLELQRNHWISADQRQSDDFDFVRQSEGRISFTMPLASAEFQECSACILRNMDTGETLMIHNDSGSRGTWRPKDAERWGGPVSPTTPRSGFIGKPRTQYEKFWRGEGRKIALLVESTCAEDRREILDRFRKDGIEPVAPLLLPATTNGLEVPRWNLVYSPLDDALSVHMCDAKGSRVLHFDRVFKGGPAQPRAAAAQPAPDIVDRLPDYRKALERPEALSDVGLGMLRACVNIVEQRNHHVASACEALIALRNNPRIPRDIYALLRRRDLMDKGGAVLQGLTQLAEYALTLKRRPDEPAMQPGAALAPTSGKDDRLAPATGLES